MRPPRIINLVELSNIRLSKETPTVDARFPVPEPDQGQWIILVGDNGVGKTTLLRALGLALADPTVATRLLDENQPFVRNGGEGRIAIELDTGPVEVIVRRDARRTLRELCAPNSEFAGMNRWWVERKTGWTWEELVATTA